MHAKLLAGATVAVAVLLPGRTQAAEMGGIAMHPAATLAAGVGLGLILAALFFLRRVQRTSAEAARHAAASARLNAIMAAAPDAFYMWNFVDGRESCSPRLREMIDLPGEGEARAAFADVRAALEEADAEALDRAVENLRGIGASFDFRVQRRGGGRVYRAMGVRVGEADAPPLADVVWFRDETEVVGETGKLLSTVASVRGERGRLEAVLDALPAPVWRRGGDLSLIWCNRAYAEALDSDRDAVLTGQRELAGTAIEEGGRGLARRARATGVAQSESHHTVINGARRMLEFTEVPIPGTDEIVGFALDYTDLEGLQTELSRHIAAHSEVLENLPTAIAIFGPERRLKFCNTAYANLWRLDPAWARTEPEFGEVLEHLREKRRLPEYADFRAFKQASLRMFTSLTEPHEELVHLPDETTLRMVVTPYPFGGLLFTYEDVTDNLALERSYNTLIDVQRETLDNLYEGVAVFGSDGRLKLNNPAYARMWRLSPEELQDEPHITDIVDRVHDFFDRGDHWPQLREELIGWVTGRVPQNGRLERTDGSVLEYACVPLPDGNVLLSYLDVTDSFRIEQALRESNEALETADRLKSEFIANVSYELRTPLNTIIGFAEILTHEYFGQLNPRQLEYSRGILDSSQNLLSLINDILDLATIEAGYMALEFENIDVHAMLVSVLALVRERARKRELGLEFDCPLDVGVIHGDARRLKQAMFNIISNAIKFTPPGGSITVSATREGGELAISVADTGIGIPVSDQERVFGKFERGTSPQARQSGAGLGLSLVKSFVELHGGRVVMESEPNHGTRVTCYLPAAAAGAEEPRLAGSA